MKKNVILLILDALRFDRVSTYEKKGYSITPNLDEIKKNFLNIENHFANGCPTAISFPSMFTSTFPLDYNGYDNGISDRPVTLAEVFKKNNYHTFGICTAHPASSYFKYNRGFDYYENLIDLYQWFRQIFKVFLREDLENFKNKIITEEIMLERLSNKYRSMMSYTEKYINEMKNFNIKHKTWNIFELEKSIQREITILDKNPKMILKKIIDFEHLFYLVLGQDEVSNFYISFTKFVEKLRNFFNRGITLFPRRRAFNAEEVVERFKLLKLNKPFFSFVHFFDIHEAKNLTLKLNSFFLWNIIKLLFLRKFKFGGFTYDLSVMSVDRSLGKFIKYLKQNNLYDNTTLVITSDHGMSAGPPYRPKHKTRNDLSQFFYDEFLHVPLIIKPAKNDNFIKKNRITSHLDLSPTILDLAGLGNESSFKGKSIFEIDPIKNGEEKYVLSENTGSGQCDIKNKTIFLSIRDLDFKVVYSIKNFTIYERDVFDLKNDPDENFNKTESNLLLEKRNYFYQLAKKRVSEIKGYLNV